MEEKTNVMRLLDQKKIKYKAYAYGTDEALSGEEVAALLGQDPGKVFKTLVTVGKSKKNYVFMVPAAQELDLKKAAAAVSEKSIEMIKSRDLLVLTGYIHGGCSPIGMKKYFTTTADITALQYDTILFSAGKIGHQVELPPQELEKIIKLQFMDISE